MAGLIYDENSMIDSQIYKYDKFIHSRVNKYTGGPRTLVTYFNINDRNTSTSLGMESHYQIIGKESPLRYDKIENMMLLNFIKGNQEEKQASTTTVRDFGMSGECIVIPGTIMPKENDFFILNHIKMNNLFRVTQVTQDGLTTNGSYRISYTLHSTNYDDIDLLNRQVCGEYKLDLQTIGGEDLTPIISKNDYEQRSRLIRMMNDMIENYIAQFYSQRHNCFICHLNGRSLFDLCGNYFMAKHGIMTRDDSCENITLNENKIRYSHLNMIYQKSPYKWIERDAPIRYLDTFKYRLDKSFDYPESSFAKHGDDVDIMFPGDSWCTSDSCKYYFHPDVYEILEKDSDTRKCEPCDCRCCCHREYCVRNHKIKSFDYVSIIHDFIHGKITSINDLSLYTGDQLFDNAMATEIYLWTPIVIYIIKQTLKIK